MEVGSASEDNVGALALQPAFGRKAPDCVEERSGRTPHPIVRPTGRFAVACIKSVTDAQDDNSPSLGG